MSFSLLKELKLDVVVYTCNPALNLKPVFYSKTLSQKQNRAREMAPQGKAAVTKANDLSLISGTRMIEGEN